MGEAAAVELNLLEPEAELKKLELESRFGMAAVRLFQGFKHGARIKDLANF